MSRNKKQEIPQQRRLTSLTPGLQMMDKAEESEAYTIKKIVSGGQTGADRAGLDAAIEMSITIGGWCPKGRKAEDGPIDDRYPLQETTSGDYRIRTERNVKESDGTVIFSKGKPTGGTALTVKKAKALKKPYIVVDLDKTYDCDEVRAWLLDNSIAILNVAGPRGSKHLDIYDKTKAFLKVLLH